MKRPLILSLSVFILIAGFLMLPNAQRAEGAVSVNRITYAFGPGINATWHYGPSDGFQETLVSVNAGLNTVSVQGPSGSSSSSQNIVNVFISQHSLGDDLNDPADDQFHSINGTGDLPISQPSIGSGSSSASLSVLLDGEECSTGGGCHPITIAINLSLLATGKGVIESSRTRDVFDGCRSDTTLQGSFRPAAVAGTIEAGGVDYIQGKLGESKIVKLHQITTVAVGDCS